MEMLVDSVVKFEPLCEGRCTCGAKIAIGYANGQDAVLHPMPMCLPFITIDSPNDYLRYLNHSFEVRGQDGPN